MKIDDVFNDIDNETAEKLADDYPVLNDDEKERLYAMSKRKYNIDDMSEINNTEVSGVEKYSKPKWYKGVSVAAAAVLVFAGIGGSMAVISRNGHAPSTDVVSEATTEAATEAETEEATEATEVTEATTEAVNIDADAIAQEMVDAYSACLGDLWCRNIQVDTSDVVEKNFPDDGITHQYYRADDPRYPTWEDLEKYCYEVFDTELGKIVLDNRNNSYAPEDEMKYDTLFFTRGDSYYVDKNLHGDPWEPIEWDQDHIEGELTPEGDITTTVTKTYTTSTPNVVEETKFRFVNTENGWRINQADERTYYVDENGNEMTQDEVDAVMAEVEKQFSEAYGKDVTQAE